MVRFVQIGQLLSIGCLLCSFSVVSAGTMRVCVDHYPPFQVLSADAEPIGENIAALRLMAKLLEHDLSFETSPNFARCLHMLEGGRVDVVAGLIDKPERHTYSYFLPFRPDSRYVFISLKGFRAIKDYDGLVDASIGVSRETQYFERFDSDQRLRKVMTNDMISATNMLLRSRFDILILPKVVLPSLKKHYPEFEQKLMVHPYTYEEIRPIYFGVSRKHQMNISLHEMERIIGEAYEQERFMSEVEQFILEHIELY